MHPPNRKRSGRTGNRSPAPLSIPLSVGGQATGPDCIGLAGWRDTGEGHAGEGDTGEGEKRDCVAVGVYKSRF